MLLVPLDILVVITVLIALVMYMEPDSERTALAGPTPLPTEPVPRSLLEEDRLFLAYREALAQARHCHHRGHTRDAETSYRQALEAIQQSRVSHHAGIEPHPYRELAKLLVDIDRGSDALAVFEQYIDWQRTLGHRPDPRMLEERQRVRKQLS